MKRTGNAAIVCMWVLLASPVHSGLQINLTNLGGSEPTTLDGGGNLTHIMETAVDFWEAAYSCDTSTSREVDVSYEWDQLTDIFGDPTNRVLAQAKIPVPPGTRPGDPTVFGATISFNNVDTFGTSMSTYFADATPENHSEYRAFTTSSTDLGIGLMNTGRKHSVATGDAVGSYDLLTVAVHEIGHALGWKLNNIFPPNEPHEVLSPPQYAGTMIPLARLTAHINDGDGENNQEVLMDAVMGPTIPRETRLLLSGVDVVLPAEQLGFSCANGVNLVAVPETSSVALVGMIGLLMSSRLLRLIWLSLKNSICAN